MRCCCSCTYMYGTTLPHPPRRWAKHMHICMLEVADVSAFVCYVGNAIVSVGLHRSLHGACMGNGTGKGRRTTHHCMCVCCEFALHVLQWRTALPHTA